jgi:hypothetical protein
MAQMADFTSRDNAMGISWIAPFLLRFRGFLEALGTPIDVQGLRIQFGDRQGGVITDTIPLVPVPTWRGGVPKLIASQLPGAPPAPLYLSNVSTPYWLKDLPEKNAVYVQFNQVMDDPAESLGAFAQRLRTALTGHPPQTLIVDVRHNNGGNADLLPPLLAVLREFEATHPHSQLVVLTGRNTFSAAQIFIAQVDRDTKAIFVGEPSSSKPNFVGEENQITLPWSGAVGSISNRYHETIPEDTRSWIEPTIKVELTARDYFANRDPVLDAVLEQLKAVMPPKNCPESNVSLSQARGRKRSRPIKTR